MTAKSSTEGTWLSPAEYARLQECERVNPTPLSLDELDRVLLSASKHGVVEMSFRGLSIRRIPDSTPARSEARTSELERLEKLPPDEQDARFMLKRTKGGV